MVILPNRRKAFRGGSVVSTADLISFWKLDEASGTRVDAHGSNDLTDNNTVGQGTGNVYANAADFVRANAEYLTSASTDFEVIATITIGAWIKIDSFAPTNGNWIINKRGTALGAGWQLAVSSGNSKVFFDVIDDPFTGTITGTTTLSTGTWYFVHGQIDGTTYKVGLNGSWEASSSYAGSLAAETSYSLTLGTASWNPTSTNTLRHDGLIGPAMFWNRALSDAEIAALADKDDTFYDQF